MTPEEFQVFGQLLHPFFELIDHFNPLPASSVLSSLLFDRFPQASCAPSTALLSTL